MLYQLTFGISHVWIFGRFQVMKMHKSWISTKVRHTALYHVLSILSMAFVKRGESLMTHTKKQYTCPLIERIEERILCINYSVWEKAVFVWMTVCACMHVCVNQTLCNWSGLSLNRRRWVLQLYSMHTRDATQHINVLHTHDLCIYTS